MFFYLTGNLSNGEKKIQQHFAKAGGLTCHIIGAAIEVHRDKGPGLIESIYEWCLEKELELCRLSSVSQKVVTVTYKGFAREEPCRWDVWVEDELSAKPRAAARRCPVRN